MTHDGDVQPRSMVTGADRAVLGNAERSGFATVWRNDEYRAFREALLTDHPPEVRSGCSLSRRVF